jgi:DnaJ-class molecular chaperone
MTRDYYQVLGIPSNANADQIRAAYRRLARLYHPDLNTGPEAETRMQEINQAYKTLSNPTLRRQHDVIGVTETRAGRPTRGTAHRQRVVITPRSPAPVPQRGDDLQVGLTVSVREASRGARKTFSIHRLETCPRCRGTGLEPEETLSKTQCWRCAGLQRLPRDVRLHTTIPPGVVDGRRLRLRGQGNAGMDGGTHGHVYITARVRPRAGLGRIVRFLLRHLAA